MHQPNNPRLILLLLTALLLGSTRSAYLIARGALLIICGP